MEKIARLRDKSKNIFSMVFVIMCSKQENTLFVNEKFVPFLILILIHLIVITCVNKNQQGRRCLHRLRVLRLSVSPPSVTRKKE